MEEISAFVKQAQHTSVELLPSVLLLLFRFLSPFFFH
jgi:hypothetical protein